MNNLDIGIIQFNLNNTQEHKNIIYTASSFIKARPNSHIIIFNSYNEIIDSSIVPILHLSQSKFFNGNILVFDIESLEFAKNCINRNNIIFYAQNIPWENNIKNFSYWKDLLCQNDIIVVAANKDIYDIFNIGFKKPADIAKEFNYESFKHII